MAGDLNPPTNTHLCGASFNWLQSEAGNLQSLGVSYIKRGLLVNINHLSSIGQPSTLAHLIKEVASQGCSYIEFKGSTTPSCSLPVQQVGVEAAQFFNAGTTTLNVAAIISDVYGEDDIKSHEDEYGHYEIPSPNYAVELYG